MCKTVKLKPNVGRLLKTNSIQICKLRIEFWIYCTFIQNNQQLFQDIWSIVSGGLCVLYNWSMRHNVGDPRGNSWVHLFIHLWFGMDFVVWKCLIFSAFSSISATDTRRNWLSFILENNFHGILGACAFFFHMRNWPTVYKYTPQSQWSIWTVELVFIL